MRSKRSNPRQFRKAVIARGVALTAACLSLLCWFGTPGNACGIDQARMNQQSRIDQKARESRDVISAQLTGTPRNGQNAAGHAANSCPYILAEELVVQSVTAIGGEVPTVENVVLTLFD